MARLHPGFSAVVVAAMALGIGLNSAAFSLLDALLLRPPSVAAPERLAHVYSSVPGGLLSHAPMAFPDFETLRVAARSFSGVAAYAWYPMALERPEGSELVLAELVTGDYFAILGVTPTLGRTFTGGDDRPGAPNPVAVLSHDGWRRHFAGAPDVVGRELRLNGQVFTVVGVTPRGFRSLIPGLAPALWLPIHAGAALPAGVTINFGAGTPGLARIADRAQCWVWVIGRLRPDTSIEQAEAELAVLASQLGREFPATNAQRALVAVAARDVRLLPGVDRTVWVGSLVVMGVFSLGLLLASANVATLFLARAIGRRREIATRLALGAERVQLVRQLFLEGLLLALAGGSFGLLLAQVSNVLLGRVDLWLGTAVNWPLDIALAPALDLRVLVFTLAAAVLTAVVFALFPALDATRSDLAEMLREIRAGASVGSSRRLRATLVAVQVAISVVLLAAAGIALRNLLHTARVDPGFDPEHAAALTLSPELLGYGEERSEDLFARARERVVLIPGVQSAAFASHLPLTFAIISLDGVAPERSDAPPEAGPSVDAALVDHGYFETLRIPMVAGRPFTKADNASAPRVVIVNEALASRLWPDASAIGRRLRSGEEVVGIARDGQYRHLGERPRPFLYLSLGQSPRGTLTLVVRTIGDPRPLLPNVRSAVRELDPRVPMGTARTLAETLEDALFLPRAAAALVGLFGALGLLLAAIGIFGLVAYLATARTREIGLRLALGASRRAIVFWLLRRGLTPVAAGLVFGVAAAAGIAWTLSRFFGAVEPIDVHALLDAALLLALVAIAASLAPAGRAAGLDPATALRQE
jgi:predicted permease